MITLVLEGRVSAENRIRMKAFIRRARPFYEAPGDITMTFMWDREDDLHFREIFCYGSESAYLADEERVRHDPEMHRYLTEWRSLLDGPVEIGVWRDIDLTDPDARTVFVFDLDGVIRRWDPAVVADAERAHGLPAGALLGVAFEPTLLTAVTTGEINDDTWRSKIIGLLSRTYPAVDGAAVAAAWSSPAGEVIAGAPDVIRALQRRYTVCLLTNATDRLLPDLTALGLAGAFDYVFNSSPIGVAKPATGIFAHVEETLGISPQSVVFVDDTPANVAAASDRGWTVLLATPDVPLQQLLHQWLL